MKHDINRIYSLLRIPSRVSRQNIEGLIEGADDIDKDDGNISDAPVSERVQVAYDRVCVRRVCT